MDSAALWKSLRLKDTKLDESLSAACRNTIRDPKGLFHSIMNGTLLALLPLFIGLMVADPLKSNTLSHVINVMK